MMKVVLLKIMRATLMFAEGVSETFREKILSISTRFKDENQCAAIRYLLNFFLLEGFKESKTRLIHTICVSYDLTIHVATLLYDYSLILMRSALHDEYAPMFTDLEILRLSQRWSLLPEIAEAICMQLSRNWRCYSAAFLSLCQLKNDIARLHRGRNLLETASEADYLPPKSSLEHNKESKLRQVGISVLDGDHEKAPLYEHTVKSDAW